MTTRHPRPFWLLYLSGALRDFGHAVIGAVWHLLEDVHRLSAGAALLGMPDQVVLSGGETDSSKLLYHVRRRMSASAGHWSASLSVVSDFPLCGRLSGSAIGAGCRNDFNDPHKEMWPDDYRGKAEQPR